MSTVFFWILAGMDSEYIRRVEREISHLFEGESTGHDWFHIDRVRRNALKIARAEGADLFVTELGALLHDVADHKFHNNDLKVGPEMAREMILKLGGDDALAAKVFDIVNETTFKGAGVKTPVSSIEAACVQDADRLDAMGAIGIARAFAFGGSRNREMYNPNIKPKNHPDFEAYAKDNGTTINHFYEKLLLLKSRMQTGEGKKMAQKRHDFMMNFLDEFYGEWEAKF